MFRIAPPDLEPHHFSIEGQLLHINLKRFRGGLVFKAHRLVYHSTRFRQIGLLLLNKQHQHRTLHIQKDVLPYALCLLLCPVSAALAGIFWMDSISTSCILSRQAIHDRA